MKVSIENKLTPFEEYQEKFKTEYYQVKKHYEELKKCNTELEVQNKYDGLVSVPKPDVPFELLREQQRVLGEYLHILEMRAVIERIKL